MLEDADEPVTRRHRADEVADDDAEYERYLVGIP
jgi:hypothetical protein